MKRKRLQKQIECLKILDKIEKDNLEQKELSDNIDEKVRQRQKKSSVEKSPVFKRSCPFKGKFWEKICLFFAPFFWDFSCFLCDFVSIENFKCCVFFLNETV